MKIEEAIIDPRIRDDLRWRKCLAQSERLLDKFCAKYDIRLVHVTTLDESGTEELAYRFNDNLGLYTSGGLRASL